MTSDEFSLLPLLVQERLQHEMYSEGFGMLIEKHQLDLAQEQVFIDLVDSVVLKKVALNGVKQFIQNALNLDEGQTDAVVQDVVGYLLLPVQDYIGDVVGFLSQGGGSLEEYLSHADALLRPEQLYWGQYQYVFGDAGIDISTISIEVRRAFFVLLIRLVHGNLKEEDIDDVVRTPIEQGGLGMTGDAVAVVAGDIRDIVVLEIFTIDDIAGLDEIRKKVLGGAFTSLLEGHGEMQISRSLPRKLQDEYTAFFASEELQRVEQVLREHVLGDFESSKRALYDAVNTQDRFAFLLSIAQLFSSGKLEVLFRDDVRYIKFWRPHILKERGLSRVRIFDENPAAVKMFGAFVRYVLERRFDMSTLESVLWGVYFAAHAHAAGDEKYEYMAYGDLKSGKFNWNL